MPQSSSSIITSARFGSNARWPTRSVGPTPHKATPVATPLRVANPVPSLAMANAPGTSHDPAIPMGTALDTAMAQVASSEQQLTSAADLATSMMRQVIAIRGPFSTSVIFGYGEMARAMGILEGITDACMAEMAQPPPDNGDGGDGGDGPGGPGSVDGPGWRPKPPPPQPWNVGIPPGKLYNDNVRGQPRLNQGSTACRAFVN